MCPFEAVVSHIEMYCELLRFDHKKGGFSCAIKRVSLYIMKCSGQYRSTATKTDWTGNTLQEPCETSFNPCAVVIWEKLKPDETSVSKKDTGFAAENINNVTWSYAIFVLLKTLWYIPMLCSIRKNTAILLVKSWNNSVYVYLVKIACYNTGDLSPPRKIWERSFLFLLHKRCSTADMVGRNVTHNLH